MTRVYFRDPANCGQVGCAQVETTDHALAIETVKEAIRVVGAVLALVKQ